ncbi:7207_t:CDS:2 [Gigaspora margarita]|uniref:7207_t:CDS:1 n=1 Tax=Gigaspora margarita TaxID=4874 RepID=A0ABN7UNQ8_GIGMA|nr:7207_t:CDS:2 [Gigaspora margarita]
MAILLIFPHPERDCDAEEALSLIPLPLSFLQMLRHQSLLLQHLGEGEWAHRRITNIIGSYGERKKSSGTVHYLQLNKKSPSSEVLFKHPIKQGKVLLNIGYSRHILEDVDETENYEESEKARIVVNTFYTQLLRVHFSFAGHVKNQK